MARRYSGGCFCNCSTENFSPSSIAAPLSPDVEVVQAGRGGGEIRREVFQEPRLAIEADQRDAMLDVPDQGFDGRAEVAIVIEVARAGASNLYRNDQGQRLAIGILLERELLGNIVIREQEVVGGQGEDRLACLGSHQCGNEHQSCAGAEDRAGLSRRLCYSEHARCDNVN